jgi:hypothetical protein
MGFKKFFNNTKQSALVIGGTLVATGVTALLKDGNNKVLLATGTTVPSDGASLYAKGCLFIDTDVSTGTTGLYCNKGTSAACQFTAVTQG